MVGRRALAPTAKQPSNYWTNNFVPGALVIWLNRGEEPVLQNCRIPDLSSAKGGGSLTKGKAKSTPRKSRQLLIARRQAPAAPFHPNTGSHTPDLPVKLHTKPIKPQAHLRIGPFTKGFRIKIKLGMP